MPDDHGLALEIFGLWPNLSDAWGYEAKLLKILRDFQQFGRAGYYFASLISFRIPPIF